MVERLAREGEMPLDWMDVGVESYRDPDKPPGDRTLYDDIRIHFKMWGVNDAHGEELVDMWKRR